MPRDPSRTTSIRAAFVRATNKRFLRIRGLVRKAVVADDVLGLRTTTSPVLAGAQTPGRRFFAGRTSAGKVEGFMAWLRAEVAKEVLTISMRQQLGGAAQNAWTNLYIEDTYERGVTRARYQMRQAGFDVPTLQETGGISASMATPFHVDRLGLLYTRTFNDLKGITEAMDTQISRVLAQGLADGVGPKELAKRLNYVINGSGGNLAVTDTLGRFIPAQRRAEMLARTEIIRAHAEAQLQEFKNWGVAGVKAQAEIITAGDNRVCEQCAALEKSVYSLQEASGVIPVHVSCRCAWLPYNDKIL